MTSLNLLPSGISHTLERNPHKVYYETIETYLEHNSLTVSPEVLAEMSQADTMWVLTWYPRTPVGSCVVVGPTWESVLESALNDQ